MDASQIQNSLNSWNIKDSQVHQLMDQMKEDNKPATKEENEDSKEETNTNRIPTDNQQSDAKTAAAMTRQ